MRTKAQALHDLQLMLRDVLTAHAAGGTRLSRRQGYVDGYMKALLDLGVVSQAELLEVVAAERSRTSGPAVGVLEADEVAA